MALQVDTFERRGSQQRLQAGLDRHREMRVQQPARFGGLYWISQHTRDVAQQWSVLPPRPEFDTHKAALPQPLAMLGDNHLAGTSDRSFHDYR